MSVPQFSTRHPDQQARLIPFAGGLLGDKVGWKWIVEVAKAKLRSGLVRVGHGKEASGRSYSWPRPLLSSFSCNLGLMLGCVLGFGLGAAHACPSAVFLHEVPRLAGGQRQGLRLFALRPVAAGRQVWEQVPLQLDPLTPEGRLIFDAGADLSHFNHQASDLLTFQSEDFGRPMDPNTPPLPCSIGAIYEVSTAAGVAYLTSCAATVNSAPVRYPTRVTFDREHHTLQSGFYRYRFNPDNYMQFASIAFPGARGDWDEVARDSRLLIHADIKNFFTMRFDSRQIVSRLEASRLGPIANLARLSFFLRILLFKIRMSLATDVGFFVDSAHIPMQVDLPVNAYERLNSGSGILYSWHLASAAVVATKTMRMPRLDPTLVHMGFKDLAKLGLSYCQGESCLFNYTVDFHGQQLSMAMDLRRSLVERGFFPMFVEDTHKPSAAMGWGLEAEEEAQRIGMYFEVSGLPEGGHPWDFWLRLGAPDQGKPSCPQVVALRLIK